jgi:hypothetical protein
MQFPINKFNINQRQNVILESPYGLYAQPMLDEGKRFHENIIIRNQGISILEQNGPRILCPSMTLIIPIEQSIEGRGINEGSHFL